MVAEFDSVAEVYDSTREAATEDEIREVVAALGSSRRVIDIGVGTGRFGVPLSQHGFEMLGVDISKKMMARAKEKGMGNLVLADATMLPFKDRAFDAATIFHVLHIVPDWMSLMSSVGRVTNGKIISLLRQRLGGPDDSGSITGEVGRLYAQLRTEMGYPITRSPRRWRNEQEIRAAVPPMKLINVRDEVVSTTVEQAIERFRAMRISTFSDVPEGVQLKIRERIIAEKGDRKLERRIIEDIAVWDARQFDAVRSSL